MRGLVWPKIRSSIRPWPFEGMPILSGKDRQGITLDRAECFE
jgi:hypothetical protein